MSLLAINMFAKAVIRKVFDGTGRQSAQVEVTKGELIDDVERMQDYGFTSNPPVAGTDAIMAFFGGNREQGVIVRMENRALRLKDLETGEVAIFDDLGNVIKLGRQKVTVTAVTEADVIAPIVKVTADTAATITSGASSIQITPDGVAITSPVFTHNGKNVGATHQHANSGGPNIGGVPV